LSIVHEIEPAFSAGVSERPARGTPQARLAALTTLRFFAAFYVVLYHAYPAPRPGSAELASAKPLLRASYTFCSHGFSAVSFFFVLSGFILAYNYPGDRRVSLGRFYRARFARIYPVYLLGLVVALPFLVVHTLREHSWGHAALECTLAFSLMQAWVPSFWNAVNIPGWSLSVEAFFYAVYPRIVAPLARASVAPARAHAALALLFLSALVGPAMGTWCFGIQQTDTTLVANTIRYAPPLALPEFAFGIVLGHLRLRGFDAPRLVARLYVPALVVLALVLASDVFPYLLLHNGLLLPLFAIVILRCSHGHDVARVLQHRWGIALGEASYSLYVLHLPVWIYVKIVIERSGFDPAAAWVFPVYSSIAIGVGLLSFGWIERPAREWLQPLSRRAE
jgi:peptidoglycan/LPS O-acetylase OafA/YrhL